MSYDLMDKESVQLRNSLIAWYQRLITGNIHLGPLLIQRVYWVVFIHILNASWLGGMAGKTGF